MHTYPLTDLFAGLFDRDGARKIVKVDASRSVPDPETGQPLKVATVELSERAICPACTQHGTGGYVSFVSDLRLAFACPQCQQLVWLAGA